MKFCFVVRYFWNSVCDSKWIVACVSKLKQKNTCNDSISKNLGSGNYRKNNGTALIYTFRTFIMNFCIIYVFHRNPLDGLNCGTFNINFVKNYIVEQKVDMNYDFIFNIYMTQTSKSLNNTWSMYHPFLHFGWLSEFKICSNHVYTYIVLVTL